MSKSVQAAPTIDLPRSILTQIGRLITIFSAIEAETTRTIYTLLRLSAREGAIAVRTPRIAESFDMITSLLDEYNITAPYNVKNLSSELRDLEGVRDWLAHGTWIKADGVLHLVITSGTWIPPGSKTKKPIKRRIAPGASPFSTEDLKAFVAEGENLLGIVIDFHRQIAAKRRPSP